MATLSFKLDQHFTLLVPELVAVSFPSEPDFVQTVLSIKSQVVIDMTAPLRPNPLP
jgi:hypothetical protein